MVSLSVFTVMLAGAALRLYQIGEQPLWLDEAFSVWMSGHSIPEIIRLTIDIDQHPPFYHLLLHQWIQWGGNSEAWVRSFSALLGSLSILVIFYLGKTLGGAIVGLLAAGVLAFSPFHVQYSQEARTYTLLTLCACLSMWMTARLLTDPRARTQSIGQQFGEMIRRRRDRRRLPIQAVETDLTWIGYMLFTALTIYGHNTAIFLPVAVNLFVVGLILYRRFFPAQEGQLNPPTIKNWVIGQIGVFLFWSPWLLAFIIQARGVYGDFWIAKPDLEMLLGALKNFLMAFLPERIGWQGLIWTGFGVLIVLAFVNYRQRMGHFWLLACLFLAPVGGELLVSVWRPIFYDRTLIWSTIPLYVLIAVGISQLRIRLYIYTAVIILVTLSLLSVGNYYEYYEKERWDQAATYIGEHVREEDIIIFNAGWTQIPFDYYFDRYNHNVEKFGAPATMFESGELEPRMTRQDLPRLHSILQGRSRVWLVYSHNWWTDPDSLIADTLSQKLRLSDTKMYNGIQIQLYEVN